MDAKVQASFDAAKLAKVTKDAALAKAEKDVQAQEAIITANNKKVNDPTAYASLSVVDKASLDKKVTDATTQRDTLKLLVQPAKDAAAAAATALTAATAAYDAVKPLYGAEAFARVTALRTAKTA